MPQNCQTCLASPTSFRVDKSIHSAPSSPATNTDRLKQYYPLQPESSLLKKTRKRLHQIDRKWLKEYSLAITARDDSSGDAISVSFRFCHAFGREDFYHKRITNRSSRNITTAKNWTCKNAFRTDNFTSHLLFQNPDNWKKYKTAFEEEHAKFFQVDVPHINTITSHYSSSSKSIEYNVRHSIGKGIIEGIIAQGRYK